MKRIVYLEGPPLLTAGIAGQFVLGEAKPVSDKIATLLTARPEFSEAGPDVPPMAGYDQYLSEALAADKANAKEAKRADKAAAPSSTQEVGTNG